MAFIGSGGKSTAMFQLARAYGDLVLLTTTTHLAEEQLGEADQTLLIQGSEDLPQRRDELEGEVVLLVGPHREEGRVGGLPGEALDQLLELVQNWGCPLLLESDGARKLPLKAPAEHEPALPDFIDSVVVVSGLSGLGQPLNENWVHRPDRFSALAEMPAETRISTEALVSVLVSDRGGLKDVPPGVRKMVLFNQIDAFPNWRSLKAYLPRLLEAYHAVGFSSLQDYLLLEVWERIAGVILAAGGSSRFGRSKQLLEWKGQTFIRNAAELGIQSGLSPVVVVTGAEREAAESELQDLDVEITHNASWSQGQSTSIVEGLKALPPHIGGVVFLLVDQPQIPPDLVEGLVGIHSRQKPAITSTRVKGRRANPVLFDRSLFPELIRLQGDVGGRVLFDDHQVVYLPWEDDRIGLDVDTPQALQQLKDQYSPPE